MDELDSAAKSALANAKAIDKATEVLEGAYDALDKAEAFAKAALEKEQASKARLAALRESRRKPAPAPVVEVVEVNPYQHLI